jgi:hypothetical protein
MTQGFIARIYGILPSIWLQELDQIKGRARKKIISYSFGLPPQESILAIVLGKA